MKNYILFYQKILFIDRRFGNYFSINGNPFTDEKAVISGQGSGNSNDIHISGKGDSPAKTNIDCSIGEKMTTGGLRSYMFYYFLYRPNSME